MAFRPSLAALATITTLAIPLSAQAFFPFITDDTGTQGSGGNQIELNYEFVKDRNDELDIDDRVIGTNSSTTSVMPASYTYGLSDDLDIYVGVARQLNQTRGWLNTELGLKWVMLGDQTDGWSLAIKPSLQLPVTQSMQQRGLGSARTNPQAALIGSYVTDTHELHLNMGYQSNRLASHEDNEPERANLWRVSAAPVYVINDQWKAGLELGFESNPSLNSQYQAFAQLGIQYAPVENLQIGLGVLGNTALNGKQNGWGLALTTGLAYQF